jgi:hypothetical protein
VFAVIKLKFGYTKVRYRGIRKNATQVFTLCALSNLFLLRRRLLATCGSLDTTPQQGRRQNAAKSARNAPHSDAT